MDIRNLIPSKDFNAFRKKAGIVKHSLGVTVSPVKNEAGRILFTARQIFKLTDNLYTQKEINDTAQDVVSVFRKHGFKTDIAAYEFVSQNEFDAITAIWVKTKLSEFGLKQIDIVRHMNIDQQVLSKLMNNKYAFTRWHKAAFYYYFKFLESQS